MTTCFPNMTLRKKRRTRQTRQSLAGRILGNDPQGRWHNLSAKLYITKKNAVVFDSDVHSYIPDSDSAKKALRSLIALVPKKSRGISEGRGKYGK